MKEFLKRALRMAANAVFPPKAICVGCRTMSGCVEDYFCQRCLDEMAACREPEVELDRPGYIFRSFHAYEYCQAAAGAVHALKYSGVRALAQPMALDMARAMEGKFLQKPDVIAYVPMHPKRERMRGVNQARELALALGKILDMPVVDALERTRNDKQQARLSREERLKNLDGAFRIRESVLGQSVILVDDVITTGATLQNCAKALRNDGAAAVFAVTYAASMQNRQKK